MGGNSFCMLFVGLTIVAIVGVVASFATAWSLVESEYARHPADRWILVGGLSATQATFKIKYNPSNVVDLTLLTLVISTHNPNGNNNNSNNNNTSIPVDATEDGTTDIQEEEEEGDGGPISLEPTEHIIRIDLGASSTITTVVEDVNATSATASSKPAKPSLEKRYGIETIVVSNLEPQRRYYYFIEEQVINSVGTGGTSSEGDDADNKNNNNNNNEAAWSGSFQTPAPEGTRFNFTIATAGCAWTGSRSHVFSQAQAHDPLLFLHLGDFHYEDIDVNDLNKRINAISTVLASSQQASLYRSTSLVSIWDDHDFLGNDANSESEFAVGARSAALLSYQMAFPHYPLPALVLEGHRNATTTTTTTTTTSSTGSTSSSASTTSIADAEVPVPIYQAFTIGTVRFIVSDLRSEATNTKMYSDNQRAWLQDELSKAYTYDYVIWVSSKPWIGPSIDNDDAWYGYTSDREQLSEFISSTLGGKDGPQNLLVLSSDAHMVAYDNGTNTYYGSESTSTTTTTTTNSDTMSFPILMSGALDRPGSVKGGPFTDGCYALKWERTHQFSTITFEFFGKDDSDSDNIKNSEHCIQIDTYRAIDFFGQDSEKLLTKRLCGGKLFVPAATSQADKVGVCEIEKLWEVNVSLAIAVGIMAGISILMTYIAIKMSESSTIGDCCCKSFLTTIFIIISIVVTIAVGVGVFMSRGVAQWTLTPISIVGLAEAVLFLFYIFIWWACCTSPNRPRRDDDDPAFTDVEPNPHGFDLFATNCDTNNTNNNYVSTATNNNAISDDESSGFGPMIGPVNNTGTTAADTTVGATQP